MTLPDGVQRDVRSAELAAGGTLDLVRETASIREDAFGQGRWDDATSLYREMALSEDFSDFLTLPAYERMP
jgi:malate synthase